MSLIKFLNHSDWDTPFFKRLARNDTGEAPGHQGGIVIPQDLRVYFPRLAGETSAQNPTIDTEIEAILYGHQNKFARVTTRYQFQTWGGERTPESRLTGSLGPLRNNAVGGDLLLFQRHKDSLNLYRLILIKQDTDDFRYLIERIHNNWGILFDQPMTDLDLNIAEEEENEREIAEFTLFDTTTDLIISNAKRVARSYAFRNKVIEIYNNVCCVCGFGLKTPSGLLELDAAHIVPRSRSGVDDARNGIALCKRHHWAFDKGLFSINETRRIIVPQIVLDIEQNNILNEINNVVIRESNIEQLRAKNEAFEWHRMNVLLIS